jgi:hypothetical protein
MKARYAELSRMIVASLARMISSTRCRRASMVSE